ncbi:MAG: efflux RND transporter permease subunit [Thermoanaerobaculia bacterium]|nr:efflux RND transporter permease subunit [Thermoanaerobaculia bacterium]
MRLVDLSTRRPVTIFIFAVASVIFGAVALQRLSIDLLPSISYPSLTVRTQYVGAAPVEIENLVTRPVENSVGVVNGVERVSSSSRSETSEVTLEFEWGTNIDLAALDVRERLDVLVLPDDAERPLLLRYDPSLDPILRLALSGQDDLMQLRRLAEDEVKRSLERIDGVAGVVVSGGLEEEIQVQIDERKLASLGLTIAQVVSRLDEENVDLTGGRLLEGQNEVLVRTVNELTRPEDIERIVLQSSPSGAIRVRDVATVVRSYADREIITRVDGVEAVEIAIYKEGGTNTVAVSRSVHEGLSELEQRLVRVAPDAKLTLVSDQATYIQQSVEEVLTTAVTGGLLAILVLFLFLRSWKTTLIIGISIPLSVIATFFLMYIADISLNIMSLGGLTLGIGLLVDNSIVVLEAIQRRRDQGMSEIDAAREGASSVGRAVVASTLTTICVFLPIVFVEGLAGQFFGDQALTVTFSLLFSLLVALTLIPMLASRGGGGRATASDGVDTADDGRELVSRGEDFDQEKSLDRDTAVFALEPSRGRFSGLLFSFFQGLARVVKGVVSGLDRGSRWLLSPLVKIFDRGYTAVDRSYGRGLSGALARPALTLGLALLALLAMIPLAASLGSELVPELVQGEFFVDVELPPGSRLEVTERRLERIERAATELPGAESIYALVGTSNQQGGVSGELRENVGQVHVRLQGAPEREREDVAMDQLRQVLDADPEMVYRFGRPSYFSFEAPIEVEIRGFNLQLLGRLGDQVAEKMNAIEGLRDIKSSTEGGNPELLLRFDRERIASLGLSQAQIADTIRSKVLGTVATDIQRRERTIDIRVRAAEGFRNSISGLMDLSVGEAGGVSIPLSAVATAVLEEGPAEIRRAEGDRVAVITANLEGRDLASATSDIEGVLQGMTFPAGFDWRIGGQGREMERSFDSLRLAIFLAIFLVYLVMASQFESLLHPLVILFSIPFSLIGVILTLAVFDVNVSIVVLIGGVLLAGIVVNNAILLVDAANQRRDRGMEMVDALKGAANARLRPILMTTATTVLGLLPMAIGLGEGSELRRPMALTVIGGLVASTVLTLVIIPVVYRLVEGAKDRLLGSKAT